MRNHHYTRGRKGGRDVRKAFIVMGLTAAIIGSWAYITFVAQPEYEIDASLCPINQPLTGHTIFVVDRSDNLTPELIATLGEKIDTETSRLRLFQRFSLYVMDRDEAPHPRLLFSKCNPGNNATSNLVFQTPKKMQRLYVNEFVEPLKYIVASIDPTHRMGHTPLFSLLLTVPELRGFGRDVPARRLILFSDMIQNERRYSQVTTEGTEFTRENYLNADVVMNRLFPDLQYRTPKLYENVEILVFQHHPKDRRAPGRQSDGIVAFWERIFSKHFGAKTFEIEPI